MVRQNAETDLEIFATSIVNLTLLIHGVGPKGADMARKPL